MEKIRHLLLGTSLAVAVALAGGSAFAADLPQGVVSAPPPAEAGGSYVSVFGGVALPVTASGNYGSDTTFDAAFGTGYIAGAAIGTHFAPNLRGEVELSYASHNVTGTLTVGSPGGSFTTTDSGSLSTLYLLGNLWYDIDTGGGITPYIGGGAGLAVIMPGNFAFGSGGASFNTDAVAPAGQLGLGIKFQLADNMTVDLGYRAKGVFNATLTGTNGPNATSVHYVEQTVQLGLTVGF